MARGYAGAMTKTLGAVEHTLTVVSIEDVTPYHRRITFEAPSLFDGQPTICQAGGTSMGRDLVWEGCHNVRDLGGLPVSEGHRTRWGAVVRSATPDRLTSTGWAAAAAHGIRTIVDLRNPGEADEAPVLRPHDMAVLHLPLERPNDATDPLVGPIRAVHGGTPMYLSPFMQRWPERSVQVLSAIAQAPPGGVLIHCQAGRDRTGLIAILLLALAGVDPEHIVADYELSAVRLHPHYAQLGAPDDGMRVEARLTEAGTTSREVIRSLLDGLDVENYLRSGGLSASDMSALRDRLIEPIH